MLRRHSAQGGFSLIELAIGLVIVATMLSALLVPLATQLDQRRTAETQALLEEAREALLGFAIGQDRFPCPASDTSNGQEAFDTTASPPGSAANGQCLRYRGWLPAATLGLSPVDRAGYQTDGFGGDANRIRYAIADYNNPNATDKKTFTATGGMTGNFDSAGLANVATGTTGRLSICSQASTANTTCSAGAFLANGNAVAVILSVGKNPDGRSDDENENLDTTAANRIFVSRTHSDLAGGQFDDLVLWISPNVLISRLAAAGKIGP
jgi:prepilin-type N-terminal cleavage/methylation domain-containing protein